MKLLVDPRVTIARSSKSRYGKLVNLAACLEMIKRVIEPVRSVPTGRKMRAVILHGPRNLKLECIPEVAVLPTQVERFFRFSINRAKRQPLASYSRETRSFATDFATSSPPLAAEPAFPLPVPSQRVELINFHADKISCISDGRRRFPAPFLVLNVSYFNVTLPKSKRGCLFRSSSQGGHRLMKISLSLRIDSRLRAKVKSRLAEIQR